MTGRSEGFDEIFDANILVRETCQAKKFVGDGSNLTSLPIPAETDPLSLHTTDVASNGIVTNELRDNTVDHFRIIHGDGTLRELDDCYNQPAIVFSDRSEIKIPSYADDGFVKTSAGTGKIIVDTSTYLPTNNANFATLTDDSMADTLHRHSELSASDGTPNVALQVDIAGNVGIGVTDPAQKLDVNGIIKVSGDVLQYGNNVVSNVDNELYLQTGASKDIIFRPNSTEKLRLSVAGNLTCVGDIKGGGYKSSDDSAGITTTITTASLVGKTITIKNGLIIGFA